MEVLKLTKGDIELIFKVATIPYGLGVQYGWTVEQINVEENTILNEYSEIRN